MWRTLKILTLLALVPGGVLSQVSSTLPQPPGVRDLPSRVVALEKARDSLLQARQAVDAALAEVEVAIEALRALTEPAMDPALALRPAVSPLRPAVSPQLSSLLEAATSLRKAINERLRASQPTVEELRWAACQALVRRDHAENDRAGSTEDSSSGERSSNREAAAPLQAAVLREEDVHPFPALAFSGTVGPVDCASVLPGAPLAPLTNPTASVTEAARDRNLSSDFSSASADTSSGTSADTSACVEPFAVMPPPVVGIEPVLPLTLSGN